MDRTQERLGRADLGIIRVRKWLQDAAVALRDRGTLPPGMDPTSFRIRPASVLLPKDVPWVEGSQERLEARITSATSLQQADHMCLRSIALFRLSTPKERAFCTPVNPCARVTTQPGTSGTRGIPKKTLLRAVIAL